MVTLAEFFSSNNRPAEMNQEHLSGKTVGQFMTIGSIFQHQGWAHTSELAVFFSMQEWAPTSVSAVIFNSRDGLTSVQAAFLRRSSGPIHCHWQYFYP